MIASSKSVGVVGLGLMGRRLATRLALAGVATRGWNRSPRNFDQLRFDGVCIDADLPSLVSKSDVLVISLTDGVAVRDTLCTSRAWQDHAARLVIDTSSIAPEEARAVSAWLSKKGIGYVDAPVSGGTVGAELGTLAIFAGGSRDDVYEAESILRHLGRLTHLGPVGSGQVGKLVNQIIVAVNITGLAEGLAVARAEHIDLTALLDAMKDGLAGSRVLDLLGPRMIAADFEARGRLSTHIKDLDNALSAAGDHGLQLTLTQTARVIFASVLSQYGDLDHSAAILDTGKSRPVGPNSATSQI